MSNTRTITRDLIVSITGPGWNYSQARMLTDSNGNVALFAGRTVGPPVQTFTLASANVPPTHGALDLADDGGRVQYRRRGASCSWKLAKCNCTTDTLAKQWGADA